MDAFGAAAGNAATSQGMQVSDQSMAPSSSSFRRALIALFAWFAAAMLGLAAGAVWMVVALYAQAAYPWVVAAWLALPAGALLALTIRQWIWPHGVVAALMSAFATLLAAAYVSLLLAAIRLGGAIGINIIDAMRSAGLHFLSSIAWLAITPADLIWFVLGAALAAWLAWLRWGKADT